MLYTCIISDATVSTYVCRVGYIKYRRLKVKIMHGAKIINGAKIMPRAKIMHGAKIMPRAKIRNRTRIGPQMQKMNVGNTE